MGSKIVPRQKSTIFNYKNYFKINLTWSRHQIEIPFYGKIANVWTGPQGRTCPFIEAINLYE